MTPSTLDESTRNESTANSVEPELSASHAAPRFAPGSLRELLVIAVPMMLSSATQSLMHVIDRIFVTWDSQAALAAAMPAGMCFWTVLSLFHGTVGYTNTFVAQYEGAKQRDRVAAAVWQGIYFSIFAGGLLMGVSLFADELFQVIGHDPDVQRMESDYFRILCLGGIPTLLTSSLPTFFSGRGKTKVLFAVNVLGFVVNAVLDYCLIFGKLGFPKWGISGAAWATVWANVVMAVVFAVMMFQPANNRMYHLTKQWHIDWALMKRMLYFGGPSGLLIFADVAGWTIFLFGIGWIGQSELAATNIAFNLNSLVFFPVLGTGIAVSTLVGNRIGEQRPDLAARTTWWGCAVTTSYVLICGLVYVTIPDVLLSPYRHGTEYDFEAIHQMVVSLLRFVALYSFFDSLAIIFGFAVRGAGDTYFSLLFTLGCAVFLLVLPTLALRHFNALSLMNCWLCCSVYIAVSGIGFLLRFLGGRWRTMSVVEESVLAVH